VDVDVDVVETEEGEKRTLPCAPIPG